MPVYASCNRWQKIALLCIIYSACILANWLKRFPESSLPDEVDHIVVACQEDNLFLKCKNRYNKLAIKDIFYGREDLNTCSSKVLETNKLCHDITPQGVIEKVRLMCGGENKCKIPVSPNFLEKEGEGICPEVRKYLKIGYSCQQDPRIDMTCPNNCGGTCWPLCQDSCCNPPPQQPATPSPDAEKPMVFQCHGGCSNLCIPHCSPECCSKAPTPTHNMMGYLQPKPVYVSTISPVCPSTCKSNFCAPDCTSSCCSDILPELMSSTTISQVTAPETYTSTSGLPQPQLLLSPQPPPPPLTSPPPPPPPPPPQISPPASFQMPMVSQYPPSPYIPAPQMFLPPISQPIQYLPPPQPPQLPQMNLPLHCGTSCSPQCAPSCSASCCQNMQYQQSLTSTSCGNTCSNRCAPSCTPSCCNVPALRISETTTLFQPPPPPPQFVMPPPMYSPVQPTSIPYPSPVQLPCPKVCLTSCQPYCASRCCVAAGKSEAEKLNELKQRKNYFQYLTNFRKKQLQIYYQG